MCAPSRCLSVQMLSLPPSPQRGGNPPFSSMDTVEVLGDMELEDACGWDYHRVSRELYRKNRELACVRQDMAALDAELARTKNELAAANRGIIELQAAHATTMGLIGGYFNARQEAEAAMAVERARADAAEGRILEVQREAQSQIDEVERAVKCVVCYNAPREVRMPRCNHVCMCASCESRLTPKRCPMCRSEYTKASKVVLN